MFFLAVTRPVICVTLTLAVLKLMGVNLPWIIVFLPVIALVNFTIGLSFFFLIALVLLTKGAPR